MYIYSGLGKLRGWKGRKKRGGWSKDSEWERYIEIVMLEIRRNDIFV